MLSIMLEPQTDKVIGQWRHFIKKRFIIYTIHKIILGDHMKKDEMGEARSTRGTIANT